MEGGEPCWSCGETACPSSALNVSLRREEGTGVSPVSITIAYRKARIRVPLCVGCRKAWRPALRARKVALWSLTLGLSLALTPLVMVVLRVSPIGSGTMFSIAVGIGALAAAVGLPAYRAQARHPQGLRHPHTHPDVVALTSSGFGILN